MTNTKSELRARALAARDALSEKKRAAAAAKLARRGLPFELLPGSIVSGYSPIRSATHPMFMRPLVNRNPAETNRTYAPGHEEWAWAMGPDEYDRR